MFWVIFVLFLFFFFEIRKVMNLGNMGEMCGDVCGGLVLFIFELFENL